MKETYYVLNKRQSTNMKTKEHETKIEDKASKRKEKKAKNQGGLAPLNFHSPCWRRNESGTSPTKERAAAQAAKSWATELSSREILSSETHERPLNNSTEEKISEAMRQKKQNFEWRDR